MFTATFADLRTLTLTNYSSLSTATGISVWWDMVNHDLRLWANELICFSLGIQPAVVPPPPKMVYDISPVPAVGRTVASFQGGDELLNIVEEASQGQRGVEAGGARHKTAA